MQNLAIATLAAVNQIKHPNQKTSSATGKTLQHTYFTLTQPQLMVGDTLLLDVTNETKHFSSRRGHHVKTQASNLYRIQNHHQ